MKPRILCSFANSGERNAIRLLFEELKYSPDYTYSVSEVISKLSVSTYDICIMNPDCSPLNGFDASQMLRKDFRCFTPIIAVTRTAGDHFSDRCFHSGMNDYISSPFSASELEYKIRLWTSNRMGFLSPYEMRLEYIVRSYQTLENMIADNSLTPDFIASVCTRLLSEVRMLFDYEERLMRRINYPGMDDHALEHKSFLRHLDRLRFTASKTGLEESVQSLQLECKWFFKHIDKFDTPLYQHLKNTPETAQVRTS